MTLPVLQELLIYYNIADFFDLSAMETVYRSEEPDSKEEKPLDRNFLTVDEQTIFDLLLKRGSSEAFQKLQVFRNREASEYFGETEPDFERSWGWNTLPAKTVAILNAITSPETNLHYTVTDAGTLTTGSLVVVANDIVYFDGTNWLKDNTSTIKYIFYYLQLPVGWDQNNNWTLDDKIKEFITMYVVKEWFKRKKYLLNLVIPEFEDISNELGRIINYRRSARKTVRTF